MTGTRWLGTSWKMTKTLAEARAYVDELSPYAVPPGVQPFLLPAHTALAAVRDRLPAGSPVRLGTQNAHWSTDGEVTGEISMAMAADAGATIVAIGHSDRRTAFGETDLTVARKVAAAVAHGLTPLVCVGEPRVIQQAGRAASYVAAQVTAALSRLAPDEVGRVLLAYEPVWAIGSTGQSATPDQIVEITSRIAEVATTLGGHPPRAVLYGGSVDPTNADQILALPPVDGLFVGRAAWTPAGFVELLQIAAQHACVPA